MKKKFIFKICLLILIVYVPVISINYIVDPARLYHNEIVDNAVNLLLNGNVIESPGDWNEGLFQKKMISSLPEKPETVIIGSSHVMYVPWEYENYYVAGVSGAYLGDYFAIAGLLESYDKLPERIVFGVDAWAFMSSYSEGRHEGIREYARQEYDRITAGNVKKIKSNTIDYNNIKEMLSFSYFQSSVNVLRYRGLDYYMNNLNEVTVIGDNEASDTALILPNGRRVMNPLNYSTVETNRAGAQGIIYEGEEADEKLLVENEDNLEDFERLVVYLQNKGIKIEFYLPPWFPTLYQYFKSSDKYAGLVEIETSLRELGGKYNVVIHGSYNPDLCGVTEEDFADYLHLKEDKTLENYNKVL